MRLFLWALALVFLLGCQSEPTGVASAAEPTGEPLENDRFQSRGAYEAEVFLIDYHTVDWQQAGLRPITVTDHHSFAVSLPGSLAGKRVFVRAGGFAQEVWLDVEPGGVVGVGP